MRIKTLITVLFLCLSTTVLANTPHVVFLAGDDEYRSEESLPMLASLLREHYGFRTTVLYMVDPRTGFIDPGERHNMPGLEVLAAADLVVMFLRFRQLPADDLAHIDNYLAAGKPLVAFRTTTHAFRYGKSLASYVDVWWGIWISLGFMNTDEDERLAATYNDAWPQKWLGQSWITHHGHFDDGQQPLTEVTLVEDEASHPILRGVSPFAAYSWLYHMQGAGSQIHGEVRALLRGRALKSNHTDDNPDFPDSNPVAWTRRVDGGGEQANRVFYTSLGHPYDFHEASMRRLALNGMFWALQREAQIPPGGLVVDLVGPYDPPNSGEGEGSYREGRRPDQTDP